MTINDTKNTEPELSHCTLAIDYIHLSASQDSVIQTLFSNGLLWCYGFHHEEAARHFQTLLNQDPQNVLGLWGQVYSLTPFYNRPWSWYSDELKSKISLSGYDNLSIARSLTKPADKLAGYLVEALSLLYRTPHPPTDDIFQLWQQDYADYMLSLAQANPLNPDLVALASEALINCSPWALWDIDQKSVTDNSRVEQALAIIEPYIDAAVTSHPGVLHMHIHALEMSPFPERALTSSKALKSTFYQSKDAQRALPPHIPHMATHIDVLIGNYCDTISVNRTAALDDALIPLRENEFYLVSRLHNLHMMMYAAMMAGHKASAYEAQNNIKILTSTCFANAQDGWLRTSLEGFFANCNHAFIRFGDWNAITQAARDNHSALGIEKQPYVIALDNYAYGIALANLGFHDNAAKILERFLNLVSQVPHEYVINNNPAKNILRVAEAMLSGEYYYHSGDTKQGLEWLRRAVDACDALDYCEPWPWMHPPRHALGALLLEQGELDEATTVYETDLGIIEDLPRCKQHPFNIWAMLGLNECYLSKGENQKSTSLAKDLDAAIAFSDIAIHASCFCRGRAG